VTDLGVDQRVGSTAPRPGAPVGHRVVDLTPGAGRRAVVRTDATECALTTYWIGWPGQRLSYSVGFTLPDNAAELVTRIPATAWTPTYDGDGRYAGRVSRRADRAARLVRPPTTVAELV
jgi:hypothetical protein